ncbi:MAG TPA: hypothetical protein DCE42_12265 [Myxococcales bacterium]|nr:hypothetical protein [Deltaproteobacteria bacterium]HAA55526.1 hypothetical protein [Myxococcales bacterium]
MSSFSKDKHISPRDRFVLREDSHPPSRIMIVYDPGMPATISNKKHTLLQRDQRPPSKNLSGMTVAQAKGADNKVTPRL